MRALLLLLLALAAPLQAQAPTEAPRPPARAEPDPPGRPLARAEAGPRLDVGTEPAAEPGAQPVAAALPPALAAPPAPEAAPSPAPDRVPGQPRTPPVLRGGPPPPPLAGLPAELRAEALMVDLAPVALAAWEGVVPPARPAATPVIAAVSLPASDAPLRPRARAAVTAQVPPAEPAPPAPYAPGAGPRLLGPPPTALAVAAAVVPALRPPGLAERAERAAPPPAPDAAPTPVPEGGGLCGEPRLRGAVSGPVGEGACAIEGPVTVTAVDGVALSRAVVTDCGTARALLTWVREGARPALGDRGLSSIDVMGSYACRPRNNQAGARLSEHGRGRAVDVGGVTLGDGTTLSVLRDWPDPALRAMHDAACGPFSTVLGPEANAQHRNHFHFDTARGRGPYCR